jgi:hypothetical protein
MYDDDLIIGLVKQSFESHADSVEPSTNSATMVRARLLRRRFAGVVVASAAILAATLFVTLAGQGGNPAARTKPYRLSGHTFRIPADARTSTTCLNGLSQWSSRWRPSGERGPALVGLLSLRADGTVRDDCTAAAFTYTTMPPPVVDIATAPNGHFVYLAAPTNDIRVGYVALSSHEAAHAARSIGGPTSVPYYIIGEMPSDNDQSVLVSVLQDAQVILDDR